MNRSIAQIGFFSLAILSFAVVFALASAADPPAIVNEEAAKLKNPEPYDQASIDAGDKLYEHHCAGCHGKTGKGDGGLALGGGDPSNLTDESWDYGGTDGEIFWVIKKGIDASADMLAYEKTLTDKEMWQIVIFMRSFGPKDAAQGK